MSVDVEVKTIKFTVADSDLDYDIDVSGIVDGEDVMITVGDESILVPPDVVVEMGKYVEQLLKGSDK